mmetsp:Transcript_2375/g.5190  ORF Transcript_2375/g.5190 Transcript_2375/m.5190 type:complete len:117 (-) Transcript_2375:25-375(-)
MRRVRRPADKSLDKWPWYRVIWWDDGIPSTCNGHGATECPESNDTVVVIVATTKDEDMLALHGCWRMWAEPKRPTVSTGSNWVGVHVERDAIPSTTGLGTTYCTWSMDFSLEDTRN